MHFLCSRSHIADHILHRRPTGSGHCIDWYNQEFSAKCGDPAHYANGILCCCWLLYFWLWRRHWWQRELGNSQYSYAYPFHLCDCKCNCIWYSCSMIWDHKSYYFMMGSWCKHRRINNNIEIGSHSFVPLLPLSAWSFDVFLQVHAKLH